MSLEEFMSVEEIKSCHILFISASEAEKYKEIFAALQGRAVLMVGDTEGFARQGGMVRFLTEEKRIRRRINLEAAKDAGLSVNSNLLRAAEIVGNKRKP